MSARPATKENTAFNAAQAFAPKQERSEKSRAALLGAARALITEGGVRAVTIAGVAARAGLTKGAFYARFPDKAALLETLAREQQTEQQIQQEREREQIRDYLTRVSKTGTRDGTRDGTRLARALEEGVLLTLQICREERAPDDMIAAMRALFWTFRTDLSHPDPAIAAQVFSLIVSGTCKAAAQAQQTAPGTLPDTDAGMTAEIMRALAGYLGLKQ